MVEPYICHNLKNNYLFFSFLTKKRENELRIVHGSILVNIRVLVTTRKHKSNKSPNCSQTWLYHGRTRSIATVFDLVWPWLYLAKHRQIFRQKSISKNEVSCL